jgi:hypothetical protein
MPLERDLMSEMAPGLAFAETGNRPAERIARRGQPRRCSAIFQAEFD